MVPVNAPTEEQLQNTVLSSLGRIAPEADLSDNWRPPMTSVKRLTSTRLIS